MTLDRKTVNETAARHIRQIEQDGRAPQTAEQKRKITDLHVRMAQRVVNRKKT